MAAHLHDSVLQTLALIQKNSHDSAIVARLARSQERDLRSWLFEGDSTDSETLAGALRTIAAEVEDNHGVDVDVVCVGDCPFDEPLRAVVNATREALVNAAKHAGTGKVDVYVEVSPSAVDVFVRDRGVGFDLDAVPEDRIGVRRSIVDRMDRHGGTAEVRSTPGEGTEVRLHLPRRRSPTRRTMARAEGPRRHRRRPRHVPQRRTAELGRRGRRGRRGRPTSTRRSRPSPSTSRTSCCSTCTSPVAAASR